MNKKLLAGAIFILLGMFMITAPSLKLIYAADEQGTSGGGDGGGSDGGGDSGGDSGGSNDSGGDSGGDNSNDNSGDNSNDNSQDQQKEETKSDESNNDQSSDNEVDHEALKGTPEEQEKAAVEDYINEEPGIKKPYPPVTDKPKWGPESTKHIHKCYGEGKGSGCFGGNSVANDYPTSKGKGDGWGGDGWNKGGDKGKGNYWCKWHSCGNDHHSHGDHDHHHNHNHNYHNDKHHYDSHTNKYYYYYSNDYSNNHATVILQLDYHGTNDVHDVNIEIGNDFDATFNLAGEPENLVITGLDLDSGENFSVCIENDGDVNCESGHISSQNEVDYVDIRVP